MRYRTPRSKQAVPPFEGARKGCAGAVAVGTQTCAARALTIDAARNELLRMLGGGSNREQRQPAAAQERRLSLEEIATVRRFYNGTVLAFKEMRAKARAQREAPPSYPPMVEEMQALVERLSAPGR